MRSERIVAAAFLPHNAGASVALLDRWEEARPLLLARLLLGAAGAVLAAAALAGAIEVGERPATLLLAAFLAAQLETAVARRASSPRRLGTVLSVAAVVYAAIALGAMLSAGASGVWLGPALLVLLVAASGLALSGRELALVTAASALALLALAVGNASGVLVVSDAAARLAWLSAALVALAALPLTALVTHAVARRARHARK